MGAGLVVGGGGGRPRTRRADDLRELGERLPGPGARRAPRGRDLRSFRPVQHRPAPHPLGQLPQHRRHRVRAGRRRGEALLGVGDPAEFREAGLGHQLPDRAGHPRERGLRRHLQQGQPVRVACRHQSARHRVVHGSQAEAESGPARRDDPRHVIVEVGARARRLRDVDTRRQQQLPAQQIRVRVGHLRGVRPVDHDVRIGGTRDPPQGQVLTGQEGREGHRGVGGTAGSGMVCVPSIQDGSNG